MGGKGRGRGGEVGLQEKERDVLAIITRRSVYFLFLRYSTLRTLGCSTVTLLPPGIVWSTSALSNLIPLRSSEFRLEGNRLFLSLDWTLPDVTNGEIRGYEIRITAAPLPPDLDRAESEQLVIQRSLLVSQQQCIN